MTLLMLSGAGGLGAVARFILDGVITARVSRYPWGTTVINVTGSLLLGVVTGLALGHVLPERWHLVLGSGFLGGFTTFSTASLETVRLLQERRWLAGLANGIGMLAASVAAAAIGLWLGLHL
ncbi:MAG: fluoride efflux transporter CrcB [Propionibacteriaceae bacterium]